MGDYEGKQILAMKYIIRRLVALLALAAVVAVPAILGAIAYDRYNGGYAIASEGGLSYAQLESYVRAFIEKEKDDGAGGAGTAGGTPTVMGASMIGTVLMYAGDDVPADFLKCDGREVSRTEYKALYDVIGDKYGAGDGKNTFNLPNMQTRVPVAGGELSASAPVDKGVADVELAFKKTSTPSAPIDSGDTKSKSKSDKKKDKKSKSKSDKNKDKKSKTNSDKNKDKKSNSGKNKDTKNKNDKSKDSKNKSGKDKNNKQQSSKSTSAAMYFIIKCK